MFKYFMLICALSSCSSAYKGESAALKINNMGGKTKSVGILSDFEHNESKLKDYNNKKFEAYKAKKLQERHKLNKTQAVRYFEEKRKKEINKWARDKINH